MKKLLLALILLTSTAHAFTSSSVTVPDSGWKKTGSDAKTTYGVIFPFSNISSATYQITDTMVLISCHTPAAVNLKLRAATTANKGKVIAYKKTTNNANKCFMNATTGQVIDSTFSNFSGASAFNKGFILYSDGSGWKVIGNY